MGPTLPHRTESTPFLEDLTWRKSSRSQGDGGDCVELTPLPYGMAVRDSKDPGGPHLIVSPATAQTLIDAIKQGRFDL